MNIQESKIWVLYNCFCIWEFISWIYFIALLQDLFVCFWDVQNTIWGCFSWFCNCKISTFNLTSNAFFECKNVFAWMLFVTFTFNIWVLKCRHLATCICKGKKHTFKSHFAHWHNCFAWNLKMSIVNLHEAFRHTSSVVSRSGSQKRPHLLFSIRGFWIKVLHMRKHICELYTQAALWYLTPHCTSKCKNCNFTFKK